MRHNYTATANDNFAKRLRDLRRLKNISQARLAELVGLATIQIGRYERGASRPTADALKKLAAVFDVSGDYLLGGTPTDAAVADLKDRDLLLQFQEVEKLPDDDKMLIKKFLDAFLTKKQIQVLAAR